MSESITPHVLVVGTGAIGSLYGGMLYRAGANLAVVCRSAYEVMSRQGFQVASIWGDMQILPDQVMTHAAAYHGHADYLLVCLKVLPEIDVPELIAPAVQPGTAIVLIQNGIDIERPIAAAFPDNEIISGLAFVCCNRLEPARFHHLDYGRLTLGSYPGGVSDACRRLAELFRSVGVDCPLSEDIVQARWNKLVWNAPFNPLSVVAGGVTTRQLLDDPQTACLVRAVMNEVCSLAAAAGHPLPDDATDQMLALTEKMQPYKTSMLLDYEAGRPLEVEAILGNAVRLADQLDVAVPRLHTLYALLRQLNSGLGIGPT